MKTLTNLEFKRDGQKNNAIVSRETLGQSKQVTALQEENGVLKYETQDGVKEVKVEKPTNTPYKIMPSDWVVGEAPFKFKTTLKLARIVDDNDVVTLNINNELAKFKNYQIGATNLTAETLDLVAMKKPTEDLKIALVISKTDLLKLHPATKSLVYTLSDTNDYYIVGTGFNNVAEIENASSGGVEGSGFSSDWKGGELNIPSEYKGLPVKAIAPRAFKNIRNITNVYIEDGISVIGGQAFNINSGFDTTMETCILPKSINRLGSDFIYGSVFSQRANLKSIIIPDKITELNNGTFAWCKSFSNIIIPKNITRIGNLAFYHCEKLQDIKYEGTIEQWNAITKGPNWNESVPAKVVHCIDGDAQIGGV